MEKNGRNTEELETMEVRILEEDQAVEVEAVAEVEAAVGVLEAAEDSETVAALEIEAAGLEVTAEEETSEEMIGLTKTMTEVHMVILTETEIKEVEEVIEIQVGISETEIEEMTEEVTEEMIEETTEGETDTLATMVEVIAITHALITGMEVLHQDRAPTGTDP